jgi:hypothetical protein
MEGGALRRRNAMNWFRENRFLGTFGILFGVSLLGATAFLVRTKDDSDEAAARFATATMELNRLQRLSPYPSEENLRKMKVHAEDYATALGKLKEELKLRVVPAPALKPNEFQSRLRVALDAITEKAHANKVRLPDRCFLGFDEFAAALPNEAVAPLLGQELVQVEWVVNALLDARVAAVTALNRAAVAEGRGTTEAVKSGPAAAVLQPERNVVEVSFLSTPAAARRAINQIASASRHFCIIRQLHVRNENQTGPPRDRTAETATALPATSPAAKAAPAAAVSFIVGEEKIATTAKIEIVRFAF